MKQKIVILQTSDVHGNILPINYASNEVANRGLAKLSEIIKEERENNENILLIDTGDILQGTPLAYYNARIGKASSNGIISVMNYLKYDAAVIGNHEFNYGQDYLRTAISEATFPWISNNILIKETGKPLSGTGYIIKKFENGIKLAVVGVTTKYIPHFEKPEEISNLNFEDAVISIKAALKEIEEETPDVVIVAYHGGFERDINTGEAVENITGENQGYELATNINGIDVLLTGHQHRKIANASIKDVHIVQPGAYGESLAKITLELEKRDNRWIICDKKSEIIIPKNKVDNNIINLINNLEVKTQKWLDTPIGESNRDILIGDPFKARLRDNEFIEFINKIQMEASETDISCSAIFDNNCIGFKAKITMRDIVSNYPYANTLKVLRIKGEDIKAALEKSAQYFCLKNNKIEINPKFLEPKIQHYNYDMWEGIEYIIDVSKKEGNRVSKLLYKSKMLKMEEYYNVVMNSYRAGGGGDYFMFDISKVVKDIPIDMTEIIANYIMKHKFIEVKVNNNWKVIQNSVS
ncbi:bifunctional metallophosphatase/5'-nucleotidase [Clostridium hydrogenum]|uniref:bifunctional metallophosphatase/5'-nucleotidase n=1 Tax=Clostridium hydrogenum TaxID=2855764 RepID=UPI002E33CFC2|nr:5'-nucleotidase C-terminal domain-containing protein [Clostridium hydrogenum]